MHEQRIGAVLGEQAHDVGLAEASREPERRGSDQGRVNGPVPRSAPRGRPVRELGVGIRSVGEKRTDDACVPTHDRHVQRGEPRAGRIGVGALVEQELHQITEPGVGSENRGADAPGIGGVDVGTRIGE